MEELQERHQLKHKKEVYMKRIAAALEKKLKSKRS